MSTDDDGIIAGTFDPKALPGMHAERTTAEVLRADLALSRHDDLGEEIPDVAGDGHGKVVRWTDALPH